jgi:hypothetical protein
MLWESEKKPGTFSGRLSLVGDLTLHAGEPISVLIQPVNREPVQPGEPNNGESGDDIPF